MPELPDVEIFKQLLDRHCLGRIIARVDVADAAASRQRSSRRSQASLERQPRSVVPSLRQASVDRL